MESFSRTYNADGWRYSVGHRTRPWNQSVEGEPIIWPVERWNGERWVRIGAGKSYADARRIATEASEKAQS